MASYVVGAFIPLIGWIMAIYLLVKSKAGHAIGVGAVSIAMFFVWLGVLSATDRAGTSATAQTFLTSEPRLGGHDRESTPAGRKIVGIWETTWVIHGVFLRTVYRFDDDGTVWETDFDVLGLKINEGLGRYAFENGKVTIRWWPTGTIERASLVWLGANRFQYSIFSHSGDLAQVGRVLTYRRL